MNFLRSSALFLFLPIAASFAQPAGVPYGSNEQAGHFLDVGDARIYYEIYGKGPPLLLLHGGLYGYIDEYAAQIPKLSEHFTVIAMATRGHGRSEVGAKPYTYRLFADDAALLLKIAAKEPAVVIGFSDGAITAMTLAAIHPELVKKAVVVGGGLGVAGLTDEGREFAENLTPESFARRNGKFVAARRQLMPDPTRWDDFIDKLRALYLGPVFIAAETVRQIRCPVLLIGGDNDEYFVTRHFLEVRALIPGSSLVILPHCGHVDSLQRPMVLDDFILPFVNAP
ncbi:MAG TPA: alpha/beta fold hydrolase [Lacunisphaera sp.]|jgi:pimeloyl-ACP methyl ester carboxylesterase